MDEFYKRVKIAGMVLFVPIMLAVGPISGYFLGSFLRNKFGLNFYFPLIFVALGFIAGIFETVRIIRLVTKIDKK